MNITVNMWAVIASAVASMVIGGLWYSPMIFGKRWMHYMKINMAEAEHMKKGAGKAYAGMFVGSLVMAYVLGYFVKYIATMTLSDAFSLAFWIWLGFVATVMFGSVLFEKKPFGLFVLNSGNQLVHLIVMSIILTFWQ